jgi:hypothetical protein
MSAEIKLTKEMVLGQLSIDLILKGERLITQGHPKAAEALFKMSVDVVSRDTQVKTTKPAS